MTIKNKNRFLSLILSVVMVLTVFAAVPFSAFAETGNKTVTSFTSASDLDFQYATDVPTSALETFDGKNVLNLSKFTYNGEETTIPSGTDHNKQRQYAYTGIKEGTRPTKVAISFYQYANRQEDAFLFFPLSNFNIASTSDNIMNYLFVGADYNSNVLISGDATWNENKYFTGANGAEKFDLSANINAIGATNNWLTLSCTYDWSKYNAANNYKVTMKIELFDKIGDKIGATTVTAFKNSTYDLKESFTFAISESQWTQRKRGMYLSDVYVWSESVDGTKTYEPDDSVLPEFLSTTVKPNETFNNFSKETNFSFNGNSADNTLTNYDGKYVFDLNKVTYGGTSYNKQLQYSYRGLKAGSRPTKVSFNYYHTGAGEKSSGFFFFPFSDFSLNSGASNHQQYIIISSTNSTITLNGTDATWNGQNRGHYFTPETFGVKKENVSCSNNQWLNFVCEYDWSKYTEAGGYKVTVKFTVNSVANGKEISSITFTTAKDPSKELIEDFTFALTEGQFTEHKVNLYFADLQVWSVRADGSATYTPPARDVQFKANYKDLLEKSLSDITLDDEFAVTAALADYEALTKNQKANLTAEKTKLDEFNAKIADLVTNLVDVQVAQFKADHATALGLTTANVQISNKAIVQAALTAYDALDFHAQAKLTEEKALLDSLLAKIEELELQVELGITQPTVSQGFSSDFEAVNSDKVWKKDNIQLYAQPNTQTKPLDNNGKALNISRVVDPTDSTNHVLQVSGIWGVATPYDFALPEHAALKKVSFRVPATNYTTGWTNCFRVVPAYLDADNYAAIEFTFNPTAAGTRNGAWEYRKDGPGEFFDEGVDLYGGFNVEIVYDTQALIAYTTITADSAPDSALTIPISYGSQKWRFALSAPYYPWATYSEEHYATTYYDNVNIEFQEGDWDDDVTIRKPVVYYSGNTVYRPGDMAIISGENLGNTVDSVEIAQLPETTSSFGYILQDKYDRLGEAAEHTAPSDPADAFASAIGTTTVELTKRTSTSLQFVIPEEFSEGMYAVKLNPRYSTEQPVYSYINSPVIDYTVGDEGSIATQGGYIRVIGKNIAVKASKTGGYTSDYLYSTPSEVASLGVKAKLKNATDTYDVTVSEVQSAFSLTVDIPNSIPKGKYELTVYNGTGGDTAWANPIEVEIGTSPFANRPDQVFDVTDYGADPAEQGNDTPGFIAALEAASQNGGGTVFIPKGVYGINFTVPIPENVHLKGEGYENTTIVFDSIFYDFGELPTSIFALESNVEISGFTFYAVRLGSVFYSDAACKNVYIHNVRVQQHMYQGSITNGAGGQYLVSLDTVQSLTNSESNQNNLHALEFKNNGTSNIKFTDNTLFVQNCIWLQGEYFNVSNNKMCEAYSGPLGQCQSKSLANCTIFENNDPGATGQLGCFAMEGNGLYNAGNTWGNMKSNNREALTTDGGVNYGRELTGIIMKDKSDPSGLTYRFATGDSYPAENRWKDSQVYVVTGQGQFQYRTVTYSMGDVIKIDSPFVTEPNRNSRVVMEDPRAMYYNVNNIHLNSGTSGTYGSQVGAVYENNKEYQTEGNRMCAHDGAPVWYESFNNVEYSDGYFWHVGAEGGMEIGAGYYGGINMVYGGQFSYSFTSMSIRNCSFKDNMLIDIGAALANDNVRDMIVDNCSFSNGLFGIRFTAKTPGVIGAVFYRLNFTDIEHPYYGTLESTQPYSDELINTMTTAKNEYGYSRIVIAKTKEQAELTQVLGDVNLDGVRDIKDVTMIRYNLLGKYSFTEQMMLQADVNEDGVIDLKDAVLLRLFLLGKVKNNKLGADYEII